MFESTRRNFVVVVLALVTDSLDVFKCVFVFLCWCKRDSVFVLVYLNVCMCVYVCVCLCVCETEINIEREIIPDIEMRHSSTEILCMCVCWR